jgi:uncharacterized membrane protein
MVGAIVIASALIFGALAGGVIVHRLDTTSSSSGEQAQGDQSGANDGRQDSSNSESSQDKDV